MKSFLKSTLNIEQNKQRPRGQKQDKRYLYTLNERINAPQMRLIDDQAKQIGLMSRDEALAMAREKELDLVLISGQANPPVVKLIDFNKFLYQENKKQQEARKGVKKNVIKDVKLSLFIGKGDFDRMVRRTQEWIADGHPVRLSLPLKGREVAKKQMGFDLLYTFIKEVGDVSISTEPKAQGRVIIAVIGKKKTS